MKSTGIVRKIDPLGRIVLPIELRRNFGVKSGDPIEIYTDKDKVILKKYECTCDFCDESDNLVSFGEKSICKNCLEKLKKL